MSRQFLEKNAIINLQTYLRAQGLIYPNAIIPPVDGIFDTQTKNALIDFQLRTTGLNVAVALLGFVQELAHGGLGQVAVFSNVAESGAVVHGSPSWGRMGLL